MKLQRLLRGRGISQRELAARIGIGAVRLSRILNGRFSARAEERRRLADFLGIPMRDVLPRRRDRWRRPRKGS